MWKPKLEFTEDNSICKVTLMLDDRAMTFAEVIQSWKTDAGFRQVYISWLADMPFAAIFWESPAVTRYSLDRVYECVAVSSSALATVTPNANAFKTYFASAPAAEVVAFENLGGDARLVAPCPASKAESYTHLLKFLRQAPGRQCHELFRRLAEEIENRLDARPLWINTSGLGIYWLHIRLDSRPKYYTYLPYKQVD